MTDIAIKLTANTNSPIKTWFLTHKPLPKAQIMDRGAHVSDGDWEIGETYVNKSGRTVKVLQKELVFMGYAALVEYSNGAIRWNGYEEFLYRIAD